MKIQISVFLEAGEEFGCLKIMHMSNKLCNNILPVVAVEDSRLLSGHEDVGPLQKTHKRIFTKRTLEGLKGALEQWVFL